MKRLAVALASAALAVGAAGAAYADDSGPVAGRVRVNPLSARVTVPPDPVRAGRTFRIGAEIVNSGATALREVEVRLARDSAIVLYDPARRVLERVGPGRDRRVVWEACARRSGSYVVLVRVTAGGFAAESPGAVVRIQPPNRPC